MWSCILVLELSTPDSEIFLGSQYLLRKLSLAEGDAFAFFKGENRGDFITYSTFCEALHQVLYVLLLLYQRLSSSDI